MNINTIYVLRLLAAFLLFVGASSCSQEEICPANGKVLPTGKYPLALTASVEGLASRTAGKDVWNDGDAIGVKIYSPEGIAYPVTGKYFLNPDGTVNKTENPLSWPYPDGFVKAWLPYVGEAEVKAVSIADQSEGLEVYDFLTAKSEEKKYTETVDLVFKHQMAKVSCILVKDDGISDKEWETKKVYVAGYTTAKFSNGDLAGEVDGWIRTNFDDEVSGSEKARYEALVVPRDMSEKEFIKVEITVTHNETMDVPKALIYSPTSEKLEAGKHYVYTITVKKDRLEVKSVSANWTDEGKWHPAEPAVFRVNLPKGHGQELIYSDNVIEKNEDYILVKGNRFDISYVVDNENIKNALRLVGDSDRDIMSRDVVGNRYVFSYYLLSEEVTLEYVEYIQVGDYYYDDGTWGHRKLKGLKKPAGIIFRSGAGVSGTNVDVPENYDNRLSTIHGYAVAMHDAANDAITWGASGSGNKYSIPGIPFNNKGYDEANYLYTGYNYTKYIVEWGINGKLDYKAAKAVTDYRMSTDENEPAAPEQSSGWYLPTVEQLKDIKNIPDRARLFEDVEGEDLIANSNNGRYWTCIVCSGTQLWIYRFDGDGRSQGVPKSNASFVRAVLTF